jgi:hypothetical protein
MIENPLRLIRELKGAPLSIILALQVVGQRVTQEYLERVTGYTDKPVSQALGYLSEIGMIDHTRAGWGLISGRAVQLPLPLDLLPAPQEEPIEGETQEDEEATQENEAASRKNSDSIIIINPINQEIKDEKINNNNNNGESRKNSDSDPPKGDVWGELERAGVQKNRRTEGLLCLEWVTSAYVRSQRERLEGEGRTWPKDAGLLISVLEGNPGKVAHRRGCRCEECERKARERYAQ